MTGLQRSHYLPRVADVGIISHTGSRFPAYCGKKGEKKYPQPVSLYETHKYTQAKIRHR